jgi:hypothetical protein
VFSTLVLLVAALYVFAIVFVLQLGGPTVDWPTGNPWFKTIPMAMFTLFLGGSLLDDITDVVVTFCNYQDQCHHPIMAFVFLVYVLLSAFTIVNMLIGVLCEVVARVGDEEGEKCLVLETKQRLKEVYDTVDPDGTGTIGQEDFLHMSENPVVLSAFGAIGVEPKHLTTLASVLFEDEYTLGKTKELNFEEFCLKVVTIRPEKPASVMDVADVRFVLRSDIRYCTGTHKEQFDKAKAKQAHVKVCLDQVSVMIKDLGDRIADLEGDVVWGNPSAGPLSAASSGKSTPRGGHVAAALLGK